MIYLMLFFEFYSFQGRALIYRKRHPLLNPKAATRWTGYILCLVSGWTSCDDSLWWSIFQLLLLKAFSLKSDCQPSPLKI